MEKPQALSANCIFVSLSVLWLCAGYSYKCLVLFPADLQLMQEVLVSFGRRVLCYPLYRHFSLVSLAIHDTAKILHSGETRLPDLHRQHAHICTKAHKDHYYLCRLVVTL